MSAFTLMELLVVIAIVAMLCAMVMPMLTAVRATAQTTRCQASLRQIGMAMGSYAADYTGRLVTCAAYFDPASYSWYSRLRTYVDADDQYQIASLTLRSRGGPLWGCPTFDGILNPTGSLNVTKFGYGLVDQPGHNLDAWGAPVPWATQENNWGITYWGGPTQWRSFRLGTLTEPSQRMLCADSNDWHLRTIDATMFASRTSDALATAFLGGPRHRGARVNVLLVDGHVASMTATQAITSLRDPAHAP